MAFQRRSLLGVPQRGTATTTPQQLDFDNMTVEVIIKCTDATNDLRVGITSAGLDASAYFTVGTGTQTDRMPTMELDTTNDTVRGLFIRADAATSTYEIIPFLDPTVTLDDTK